MKIVAIEAFPFRLPLRREFKWAGLVADLGGFVVVRVETEGGVIGNVYAKCAIDIALHDAWGKIVGQPIYLAKTGGFVGASKVAHVAEAQRMRCDANGSIESAIGTAANVHFALAHPAVTLGAVFAISAPVGTHPYKVAGRYYEDDILAEPMVVKDGGILLLDAPGHVLDDMLDGLVSRDHAEAAYGVVITADGLVDGPATTILRAQRKG